jgi:hypothetical protein
VRLEGLGLLTFLGIEPTSFWLVAECLNELRYRIPKFYEPLEGFDFNVYQFHNI